MAGNRGGAATHRSAATHRPHHLSSQHHYPQHHPGAAALSGSSGSSSGRPACDRQPGPSSSATPLLSTLPTPTASQVVLITFALLVSTGVLIRTLNPNYKFKLNLAALGRRTIGLATPSTSSTKGKKPRDVVVKSILQAQEAVASSSHGALSSNPSGSGEKPPTAGSSTPPPLPSSARRQSSYSLCPPSTSTSRPSSASSTPNGAGSRSRATSYSGRETTPDAAGAVDWPASLAPGSKKSKSKKGKGVANLLGSSSTTSSPALSPTKPTFAAPPTVAGEAGGMRRVVVSDALVTCVPSMVDASAQTRYPYLTLLEAPAPSYGLDAGDEFLVYPPLPPSPPPTPPSRPATPPPPVAIPPRPPATPPPRLIASLEAAVQTSPYSRGAFDLHASFQSTPSTARRSPSPSTSNVPPPAPPALSASTSTSTSASKSRKQRNKSAAASQAAANTVPGMRRPSRSLTDTEEAEALQQSPLMRKRVPSSSAVASSLPHPYEGPSSVNGSSSSGNEKGKARDGRDDDDDGASSWSGGLGVEQPGVLQPSFYPVLSPPTSPQPAIPWSPQQQSMFAAFTSPTPFQSAATVAHIPFPPPVPLTQLQQQQHHQLHQPVAQHASGQVPTSSSSGEVGPPSRPSSRQSSLSVPTSHASPHPLQQAHAHLQQQFAYAQYQHAVTLQQLARHVVPQQQTTPTRPPPLHTYPSWSSPIPASPLFNHMPSGVSPTNASFPQNVNNGPYQYYSNGMPIQQPLSSSVNGHSPYPQQQQQSSQHQHHQQHNGGRNSKSRSSESRKTSPRLGSEKRDSPPNGLSLSVGAHPVGGVNGGGASGLGVSLNGRDEPANLKAKLRNAEMDADRCGKELEIARWRLSVLEEERMAVERENQEALGVLANRARRAEARLKLLEDAKAVDSSSGSGSPLSRPASIVEVEEVKIHPLAWLDLDAVAFQSYSPNLRANGFSNGGNSYGGSNRKPRPGRTSHGLNHAGTNGDRRRSSTTNNRRRSTNSHALGLGLHQEDEDDDVVIVLDSPVHRQSARRASLADEDLEAPLDDDEVSNVDLEDEPGEWERQSDYVGFLPMQAQTGPAASQLPPAIQIPALVLDCPTPSPGREDIQSARRLSIDDLINDDDDPSDRDNTPQILQLPSPTDIATR